MSAFVYFLCMTRKDSSDDVTNNENLPSFLVDGGEEEAREADNDDLIGSG